MVGFEPSAILRPLLPPIPCVKRKKVLHYADRMLACECSTDLEKHPGYLKVMIRREGHLCTGQAHGNCVGFLWLGNKCDKVNEGNPSQPVACETFEGELRAWMRAPCVHGK